MKATRRLTIITCGIAAILSASLPHLRAAEPASVTLPEQGQGLRQANTMGGGPAPIPAGGKFRVFILAGQSNMTGAGVAGELQPPYNQPHKRIRLWANHRWEYLVPSKNFGPEVSFSHRLAELWPEDTIGIIKVAIGGTGILAFSPTWSREQADRTKDGHKGNLYKDITDTVAAARAVSSFELAGFLWRQGGTDMAHADLAAEYLGNFTKMILALRKDLQAPRMPVFGGNYMTNAELEQRRAEVEQRKPGSYAVIKAQNDAAEKIPFTVTVIHGEKLPTLKDGAHYNTEGQLLFGRMFADAVEKYEAALTAKKAP